MLKQMDSENNPRKSGTSHQINDIYTHKYTHTYIYTHVYIIYIHIIFTYISTHIHI